MKHDLVSKYRGAKSVEKKASTKREMEAALKISEYTLNQR